jgi:hypothetical protein
MREFNYRIKEGLMHGLRPVERAPFHGQSLVELYNFKAGKIGIEATEDISRTVENGGIVWPYPQIFLGSRHCIVAYREVVYVSPNFTVGDTIYIDVSPTLLDQLGEAILDENGEPILGNGVASLTVSPSGRWSFADFGEWFILTNGNSYIYADLATIPGEVTLSRAVIATLPLCGDYCNFKGQLIGCNVITAVSSFTDTMLWGGEQMLWEGQPMAWGGEVEATVSEWHGCDKRSIVWSRIGHIDMTPGVSMEAGFKNITEWNGEVLRVLPTEDRVICYGENGIISMIPHGATFGWKRIHPMGILTKFAVAGDTTGHIFIAADYTLWRVGADAKVEELGYREYMQQLTAENIMVSKVTEKQEYYISDGSITFLLTPYGLSRYRKHPTSVISANGEVFGIASDLGLDETGTLETTLFDLGNRGLKTIVAVEVGTRHEGEIYVAIRWRAGTKDALRLTKLFKCNSEGVAYPKITGTEFSVLLYVPEPETFELDYINIRMNQTDRRSMRSGGRSTGAEYVD